MRPRELAEKVRTARKITHNQSACGVLARFFDYGHQDDLPEEISSGEEIKGLVHDGRWEPVKQLFMDKFFGGDGKSSVRIGDQEKDGVVLNSYVNLGDDVEKQQQKKKPVILSTEFSAQMMSEQTAHGMRS